MQIIISKYENIYLVFSLPNKKIRSIVFLSNKEGFKKLNIWTHFDYFNDDYIKKYE